MSTMVADIKAVRKLLADDLNWCQHAPARTMMGLYVGPLDPEATAWCLTGAVTKCVPHLTRDHAQNLEARRKQLEIFAAFGLDIRELRSWNDTATYEEVLARIDGVLAAKPQYRSVGAFGKAGFQVQGIASKAPLKPSNGRPRAYTRKR